MPVPVCLEHYGTEQFLQKVSLYAERTPLILSVESQHPEPSSDLQITDHSQHLQSVRLQLLTCCSFTFAFHRFCLTAAFSSMLHDILQCVKGKISDISSHYGRRL